MERKDRLTSIRMNGIKYGYWSPNKRDDIVQRLGAYEDTGLTPAEIRAGMQGKIYSKGGQDMRDYLRGCWATEDSEALGNLETMTESELFEAWLNWEGIISYADKIIRALRRSGYVVEVPEGGLDETSD